MNSVNDVFSVLLVGGVVGRRVVGVRVGRTGEIQRRSMRVEGDLSAEMIRKDRESR